MFFYKQPTINNTSEILVLQTGLSQFGLRPSDWDIIPQSNDLHMIKNKVEDDFYFVGESKRKKNKKIEWKFITLASL
jgi:hypothetical protein